MAFPFRKPLPWGTCVLAYSLLLAATASTGAQTVSSLNWSPFLKPVVLGSGLQVSPSQINVVNQSVDSTGYIWQNKLTTLTLQDYSDLTNTISNLHVNAWAEYEGFVGGGSFSFDYTQFHAFRGNHRVWEVNAVRDWTAAIPNPSLNSTAQQYINDPTTFQNLYGNYAVTGIQYKRQIKVSFDAEFDTSLSSSKIDAALQASYGCFSGGGSVSAAQQALSVFSQVTINVTVIGPGGGTIIASGSTGDLDTLQSDVTNQLAQWDSAPPDANDAGTVDTVYVTPYTAIPPTVNITAQPSPNQVKLLSAIGEYVYLKNAIIRLGQIQTQDTNLNAKLTTYLFGKNDRYGNHIPGTGKQDEANADLSKEYAYMQSLANADGTVTDPNIRFTFDDPDAVKWHVLQAVQDGPSWEIIIIEIYSNAQVTPFAPDYGSYSFLDWATGLTLQYQNGVLEYTVTGTCTEGHTYAINLDKKTGIPHRYVEISCSGPGNMPLDETIDLLDAGGSNFYNATDWNGWPSPMLFIPKGNVLP